MTPDWKTIPEWIGLTAFLGFGIWTTLFAYGLVSERICGRLSWNPGFRRHMRWLGPLLIVFTVLLIGLRVRLLCI